VTGRTRIDREARIHRLLERIEQVGARVGTRGTGCAGERNQREQGQESERMTHDLLLRVGKYGKRNSGTGARGLPCGASVCAPRAVDASAVTLVTQYGKPPRQATADAALSPPARPG